MDFWDVVHPNKVNYRKNFQTPADFTEQATLKDLGDKGVFYDSLTDTKLLKSEGDALTLRVSDNSKNSFVGEFFRWRAGWY
jgi:hypothetical protein